MKKIVVFIAIFLLSNLYAKEPLLTKSEKEFLEMKKIIYMCVDPNWVPFEKIDKDINLVEFKTTE